MGQLIVQEFVTADAPWGDFPEAAIESGDAVEAIRRIKHQVEGTIVRWGSLTLSQAFGSVMS